MYNPGRGKLAMSLVGAACLSLWAARAGMAGYINRMWLSGVWVNGMRVSWMWLSRVRQNRI